MTAANAVAGAAGYITGPWDRFTRWLRSVMPHGLYARALLIVIMPLVVLQSIVAFMFVERQSSVVNYYLSSAVTQEIATLIDVYKTFPPGANRAQLRRIAQDRLGLVVDFLPGTDLPPPGPKPFFSSLDQELSNEIRKQIGLPFWIDTVGRSSIVEIRIKLDDTVMRVFAPRADAYNSNALIFLMWMVLTSVVVLTIAILFLRNQIKPIVRLADAAEAFGKGREAPNFRPRGAREVRRAAAAFLGNEDPHRARHRAAHHHARRRVARSAHGADAVQARARLARRQPRGRGDQERRRRDGGDAGSLSRLRPRRHRRAVGADRYRRLCSRSCGSTSSATAIAPPPPSTATPEVTVRPAAFKRCLANLVSNAARFASTVAITGHRDHRWLTVTVDDDGPGIPQQSREDVFKPFLRLDDARNQDEGGTGLGLAIARDIARSHGGDIALASSPMGGLRATVKVPV